MEILFGGIAFGLFIAAHVLAVIAVHATQGEDVSTQSSPARN
jgi:hypothetical protein